MLNLEGDPHNKLEHDPVASRCDAEAISPTIKSWELLKEGVLPFQKKHFDLTEEDLTGAFKNPDATYAIQRQRKL